MKNTEIISKLNSMFCHQVDKIEKYKNQLFIGENLKIPYSYSLSSLTSHEWYKLKAEHPDIDTIKIYKALIKCDESARCVNWFSMEGYDVCLLDCNIKINIIEKYLKESKSLGLKKGKVRYWDNETKYWIELGR